MRWEWKVYLSSHCGDVLQLRKGETLGWDIGTTVLSEEEEELQDHVFLYYNISIPLVMWYESCEVKWYLILAQLHITLHDGSGVSYSPHVSIFELFVAFHGPPGIYEYNITCNQNFYLNMWLEIIRKLFHQCFSS